MPRPKLPDPEGDWPNMGEAIRIARRARRVKQGALAQQIGLSGSALSRIESRGNLNIVTLRRIGRALQIPHHELVRFAERLDESCPTFQGTPLPPWKPL